MALTTNLLIPELFVALMRKDIPTKMDLGPGGTGVASLEMPDQIKGHYYEFRVWKQLSGTSGLNDGATAHSAETLYQWKQVGVVQRRKHVVAIKDSELAASLGEAGREALTRRAAEAFAEWWPREMQRLIVVQLKAMFTSGGCLAASHLADYSAASDTMMNRSRALRAKAKLGDAKDQLGMMIVHSHIGTDIEDEAQLEYLDNIAGQTARGAVPVYVGLQLIQNDNVYTTGSGSSRVYDSYELARGAVSFAISQDFRVYEEVDADLGIVNVASFVDFVCHITGTEYTDSTFPPSETAIGTAANWQLNAPSAKLVPIVCVKTKSNVDL